MTHSNLDYKNPGFGRTSHHRVGPTTPDLGWTVGPPVQLPKHTPVVQMPDLPTTVHASPVSDSVSSLIVAATILAVAIAKYK